MTQTDSPSDNAARYAQAMAADWRRWNAKAKAAEDLAAWDRYFDRLLPVIVGANPAPVTGTDDGTRPTYAQIIDRAAALADMAVGARRERIDGRREKPA